MKSDTQLQIRIPLETKERLKSRADRLGISVSSYVKMLINTDLQKSPR